MFFLLKSCILQKNQLKIVKKCSILENEKLGLAQFWRQKARLGSACLFWKKLGLARLALSKGSARLDSPKSGSDPTLPPTLIASNFLALLFTDPKFSALKDLNPLKKKIKNQEASSILRVLFALSKWPHLHRAYQVTVCSVLTAAVCTMAPTYLFAFS